MSYNNLTAPPYDMDTSEDFVDWDVPRPSIYSGETVRSGPDNEPPDSTVLVDDDWRGAIVDAEESLLAQHWNVAHDSLAANDYTELERRLQHRTRVLTAPDSNPLGRRGSDRGDSPVSHGREHRCYPDRWRPESQRPRQDWDRPMDWRHRGRAVDSADVARAYEDGYRAGRLEALEEVARQAATAAEAAGWERHEARGGKGMKTPEGTNSTGPCPGSPPSRRSAGV